MDAIESPRSSRFFQVDRGQVPQGRSTALRKPGHRAIAERGDTGIEPRTNGSVRRERLSGIDGEERRKFCPKQDALVDAFIHRESNSSSRVDRSYKRHRSRPLLIIGKARSRLLLLEKARTETSWITIIVDRIKVLRLEGSTYLERPSHTLEATVRIPLVWASVLGRRQNPLVEHPTASCILTLVRVIGHCGSAVKR